MPIPVLCPILGVLSAIILFCNNILNLLFVTRKFHLAMPAVIVFAFIGGKSQEFLIFTEKGTCVSTHGFLYSIKQNCNELYGLVKYMVTENIDQVVLDQIAVTLRFNFYRNDSYKHMNS